MKRQWTLRHRAIALFYFVFAGLLFLSSFWFIDLPQSLKWLYKPSLQANRIVNAVAVIPGHALFYSPVDSTYYPHSSCVRITEGAPYPAGKILFETERFCRGEGYRFYVPLMDMAMVRLLTEASDSKTQVHRPDGVRIEPFGMSRGLRLLQALHFHFCQSSHSSVLEPPQIHLQWIDLMHNVNQVDKKNVVRLETGFNCRTGRFDFVKDEQVETLSSSEVNK